MKFKKIVVKLVIPAPPKIQKATIAPILVKKMERRKTQVVQLKKKILIAMEEAKIKKVIMDQMEKEVKMALQVTEINMEPTEAMAQKETNMEVMVAKDIMDRMVAKTIMERMDRKVVLTALMEEIKVRIQERKKTIALQVKIKNQEKTKKALLLQRTIATRPKTHLVMKRQNLQMNKTHQNLTNKFLQAFPLLIHSLKRHKLIC